MTDLAIITSIYGSYDSLKPTLPQTGLDVEWVFVTDKAPADALGWRVVIESPTSISNVRAAKAAKFEPWKYTDAEASIWIDGSFRVASPRFAVEALPYADPIAQFLHPNRDCLYEEARIVLAVGRCPGPAAAQTQRYREAGHPEHWGLWASGIIVRRHTEEVKAFGRTWAREVEQGSARDQVAQPYALRVHGLRPTVLPKGYMSTPWLKQGGHTPPPRPPAPPSPPPTPSGRPPDTGGSHNTTKGQQATAKSTAAALNEFRRTRTPQRVRRKRKKK
jgi:hypothetical protein